MATNVKHLIIIHSRSRRPKPSHKTPQNQCPGENRGYTCKSWVPAFPRCSWQALNRAHALSRGIHREHVHSTSCMPRARSLSCSGGEGTSAEEEGTTAEEDEEEADSAGGGTGAPFQAPRKLLARMSQHRCAFTKNSCEPPGASGWCIAKARRLKLSSVPFLKGIKKQRR